MKDRFRQLAKERLQSLSLSDLEIKSLALSNNLFKELQYILKPGLTIGCFIPIRFEPLWHLAFDNIYQYAIPKIQAESMKFVSCDKGFIQEQIGNYKGADNLKSLSYVEPDVLLIPGLAFTKNGQRLGRGKGYYDRYLEKFKNKKIGICFTTQIFDKIPGDIWDQNMDQIITEKDKYNG